MISNIFQLKQGFPSVEFYATVISVEGYNFENLNNVRRNLILLKHPESDQYELAGNCHFV